MSDNLNTRSIGARFQQTPAKAALERLQKLFTPRNLGGLLVSLGRLGVLIGVSYAILFPLLAKIATSFMAEIDIFDKTVHWIPKHFTLDNYRNAIKYMKYPSAFVNSLALTLGLSLLQLASCTVVGYGFARFDWRGREVLFAAVLFTLVVPPQMIMIPLYLNYRYFDFFGLAKEMQLNLLGTYWPLVLMASTATGVKNGLFVYIMRQYFRGMSRDLEEAAYIDGAGVFRTFFSVMLPSAVPAMVVVFLFAFVWQWNDYFFVNIFAGNRHLLPNALAQLTGEYSRDLTVAGTEHVMRAYGSLLNNAGSLLLIAPLVTLYIVLQRYFIESVERTGLVG
ncbi:MAG: carbohydrate ABC transporter permease [Bacillota bacterium]